MAEPAHARFRTQLLDRRHRLAEAAPAAPEVAAEVARLLREVDGALARLDAGSFGLCEVCHDPIEPERLAADPLERFCLDHLTADEQRDLERDLALAARVQRGLLPEPHLVLNGWEIAVHYEPAGLVSGDYCDVVAGQDGDGGVVFLFGDVSGKGVAAAMLMSNLHATFRSLLGAPHDAASLVEQANRLFRGVTTSSHFATLVCGRAGRDGTVEVCNAGHCPPLVVSASGVATVDPTGMPVGTFFATRFSMRKVTLARGDTLLLYTDGLTEARNADDEEYGVERLTALLPALARRPVSDMVAACREDLAAYLAGAPKTDDITIMAVRRIN